VTLETLGLAGSDYGVAELPEEQRHDQTAVHLGHDLKRGLGPAACDPDEPLQVGRIIHQFLHFLLRQVEEVRHGLKNEGEHCELHDEGEHHGVEHAFGRHHVAELHLHHHQQH